MMKNRWNPDASLLDWHVVLPKNEGMELRRTMQGPEVREGFAMVGWFRVL